MIRKILQNALYWLLVLCSLIGMGRAENEMSMGAVCGKVELLGERPPVSHILPDRVSFLDGSGSDRVVILYGEQLQDQLIFVPQSAIGGPEPTLDAAVTDAWLAQYPHVTITYEPVTMEEMWPNVLAGVPLTEMSRLDFREVMWIQGMDGKTYLGVFDRYGSYMGPGMDPTGWWFYALDEGNNEMRPLEMEVPLSCPAGLSSDPSGEGFTGNYINDQVVSGMDVEYDPLSGLWCFAVYQWGYERTDAGDIGGRMLRQDEKKLVKSLFTVSGDKLICVARFHKGTEYERSGVRTDGTIVPGWVYENVRISYRLENGSRATGWLLDGNRWYHFDETGAMERGWRPLDGNWYYLGRDGAMVTGWLEGKEADGTPVWYYLQDSGVMATGEVVINGKTEVFGDNGIWIPSAGT